MLQKLLLMLLRLLHGAGKNDGGETGTRGGEKGAAAIASFHQRRLLLTATDIQAATVRVLLLLHRHHHRHRWHRHRRHRHHDGGVASTSTCAYVAFLLRRRLRRLLQLRCAGNAHGGEAFRHSLEGSSASRTNTSTISTARASASLDSTVTSGGGGGSGSWGAAFFTGRTCSSAALLFCGGTGFFGSAFTGRSLGRNVRRAFPLSLSLSLPLRLLLLLLLLWVLWGRSRRRRRRRRASRGSGSRGRGSSPQCRLHRQLPLFDAPLLLLQFRQLLCS